MKGTLTLCLLASMLSMANSATSEELDCLYVKERLVDAEMAVETLREMVLDGQKIDRECIFGGLSDVPRRHRFILPFYYIWQNSSSPAFLRTTDFLESERLFYGYLGMHAAEEASYERYGLYIIYLHEVLAPKELLPFHQFYSNELDESEVQQLKIVECFVMHDDLKSQPYNILNTKDFMACSEGR